MNDCIIMEHCSIIEQYASTIKQAFSKNRSIMERFYFKKPGYLRVLR